MSADIEALPGKRWNSHAALADAMNRLPIGASCVILWINEDGNVSYSVNATNQETVWMCHQMIKNI